MKFLLRDDDTCGMTRVEQLQRCYSDIWDYIPVCLSVIPFVIPSGADWNPREFLERKLQVPLHENDELVAFIREGLVANRLDVALHGYHHLVTEKAPSGSGFDETQLRHRGREYLYGDHLDKKTREGKRYLERVLAYKVNTFVPPGNAISKEGLRAIIRARLNMVGSPGLGRRWTENRPLDPLSFTNAIKRKFWKIQQGTNTKYPFIYKFSRGHKEVDYYTLYPSSDLDDLKRSIDLINAVNGIFILGIHYHAFSSKMLSGNTIKDTLHTVLDHVACKDNVEYITYRDLWKSGTSPY